MNLTPSEKKTLALIGVCALLYAAVIAGAAAQEAVAMILHDDHRQLCAGSIVGRQNEIAPRLEPEVIAPPQPLDLAKPDRSEFGIGVVDRPHITATGVDRYQPARGDGILGRA